VAPLAARHSDRQLGAVRLPAAKTARGGHLKVYCGTPGCQEIWWKPRHEPFKMPRILGHDRPGY